ncbi:MAG: hypothetical protein QM750_12435 [Rubrivivax sp.]
MFFASSKALLKLKLSPAWLTALCLAGPPGTVQAASYEECRAAVLQQRHISRCMISQGACSSPAQCAREARCYPGNRRCEWRLSGGTWIASEPSTQYCAAPGQFFIGDDEDEVVRSMCLPAASADERAAAMTSYQRADQQQDDADLALARTYAEIAAAFSQPEPRRTPRAPFLKPGKADWVWPVCVRLARIHSNALEAEFGATLVRRERPSQALRTRLQTFGRGNHPIVCGCAVREAAKHLSEEELNAAARSRTRLWGSIPSERLAQVFAPCAGPQSDAADARASLAWLIDPVLR